ncbi:hypothetical protein JOD29_003511 [Lysinibacillus composti]|uniref:Replication protein n=1 Tax=Lysinibacillus composti TaxID=720633 RepID=A0A3N9UBJ4_9BACI|nr:hypothetical protein [Lysinibacillus composti]MBM7610232.1 hypothetical protein [Lysinibacillus composti]RQW73843.1 hypothetical protein EBB45_14840 [Lysinibacillus composti]
MKLLIKESPLQVLPTLAKKIGLNEAIILQQMHYWLQRSNKQVEGHTWIYKTLDAWTEEFPFWSKRTIERTLKKLEAEAYIIVGKFNKMKADRTKWYRINYDLVGQLDDTPSRQIDDQANDNLTQSIPSNWQVPTRQNDVYQPDKLTSAIPIDYYKNKKEIKKERNGAPKSHASTNHLENQSKPTKRKNRSSSPKRTESIPDWFYNRNQTQVIDEGENFDYEAERQKILKKLGSS